MLDVLPFKDYLEREVIYCQTNEAYVHDAGAITLPATAANGEPVRHGARNAMYSLENYWSARRRLAQNQLESENFEEG